MKGTIDTLITFLQVSSAQQAMTLGISIPIAVTATYETIEKLSQGNTNGAISTGMEIAIGFGLTIFNEYIALKGMQDYNRVKKVLEKRGWDERIIKARSRTWCERRAIQVASTKLGFKEETRAYLREKGHRIYHLIPI